MTEYYKTYSDYGVDDKRSKDPYFVCVLKDQMLSDSNTYLGPVSEPCFEYMTDRCAQEMKNGSLDEACMAYLNNEYNTLPDIHRVFYKENPEKAEVPMYNTPTVGELARRGVAEKAYCTMTNVGNDPGNCTQNLVKFDPTKPESPVYKNFAGNDCMYSCDNWNGDDLKDNSLINQLVNDKSAEPLLNMLCNSAAKSGKDLGNQKLINFCNDKMAGMNDLKEGYGDQDVGMLADGFQRDMYRNKFLPRTSMKEAFRSRFVPRTERKEAYQMVGDMNQNFQLLGNREGYGNGGNGQNSCLSNILLLLVLVLIGIAVWKSLAKNNV